MPVRAQRGCLYRENRVRLSSIVPVDVWEDAASESHLVAFAAASQAGQELLLVFGISPATGDVVRAGFLALGASPAGYIVTNLGAVEET